MPDNLPGQDPHSSMVVPGCHSSLIQWVYTDVAQHCAPSVLVARPK